MTIFVNLNFSGWKAEHTKIWWTISPERWKNVYQSDADSYLSSIISDNEDNVLTNGGLNPVPFIDAVLGPEGWELIAVQDAKRLMVTDRLPNWSGDIKDYSQGHGIGARYFFKRETDTASGQSEHAEASLQRGQETLGTIVARMDRENPNWRNRDRRT